MSRPLAAGLFLVAVTCAYTWPLPLHPATYVPHDEGDPLLVTWLLWWSTHTVPLTMKWWNAPAFYPATGVFAFSENLLGLAPLTAPILWLGRPPLLAYNVAFFASFVLSGLGAYLLGFVLTRRHGPALVAGVAFAFNPYRLSHLNHLQLLSSYWMPVALAMLHLYATDGRARWAVLFAFAWLMQALACGYYFFYLSLLAVLWLAWFVRGWKARRFTMLATAWVVAALLIAPLLAGYKRIQDGYGFRRVPSEIAYYSADVAGIVTASPNSLLWRGLRVVDKPESELFPGAALLLLGSSAAIVALRGRRGSRAILIFYCGAAVVMWLLALGPAPALHGRSIGVPGLYAPLMAVPGFNAMRVPARLWMVSILCLSAAAAVVVSRVQGARLRGIIVTCAVLGLLLDGWPAALAMGRDPGMLITHNDAVARLGLPLENNETETMYGAIAQDRPVFNGYSGYVAPQHRALADLLNRHDPRILPRLALSGPLEVIVRHDLDPDRRWQRFVANTPGAIVTDATPQWTAYEIRGAVVRRASLRAMLVQSLPIARVEASVNNTDVNAIVDGDLETRWHTDSQVGGETVVADLGLVAHPASVQLCLGTYSGQYPRELEVATSVDKTAWDIVWKGDTALITYDGAVASPRQVPIEIALRGSPARYIRLRQTGHDPARGWTIVELRTTR